MDIASNNYLRTNCLFLDYLGNYTFIWFKGTSSTCVAFLHDQTYLSDICDIQQKHCHILNFYTLCDCQLLNIFCLGNDFHRSKSHCSELNFVLDCCYNMSQSKLIGGKIEKAVASITRK